MVSADFPDVDSAQRKVIYDCLEKKGWIKVREFGRDISTVWHGSFNSETSEARAREICIENFVSCSKPHTSPKLVIHWGPNKPTFFGLT